MGLTGVQKKIGKAGKSTGKGKAGHSSPGAEGVDDSCKVYVGNLAYKTSWRGLKDHFKQVGGVAFTKVLTHFGVPGLAQRDGWSKGTGVVEFETASQAADAVATLNNSELDGREIFVDSWDGSGDSKVKDRKGGGKNKGAMLTAKATAKGGGKGRFGFEDMLMSFFGKGKGGKGGKGGDFKRANPACKVWVGSLPYSASWQRLKDHMSQAGEVVYCKINTDASKGFSKSASGQGWSKGTGLVEYSTSAEAKHAISMLNESDLDGRNILVDMWGS